MTTTGTRRIALEPRPEVAGVLGRRERVDEHRAALGGVREGRDPRLPAEAGVPVRVLELPQPETRRDVADLQRAGLDHGRQTRLRRLPIDHVKLPVTDLDASRRFYTAAVRAARLEARLRRAAVARLRRR